MKESQQESEALAEQVETLRKDISELTRTVSRLAKAGVSDAQDAVRETASDARDIARRSAGDVEAAVRDNPLQAALIAAGIGFAIGIMARR